MRQGTEKNAPTLKLPNPHKKKDIGIPLLTKLLEQAKIDKDDWIAPPKGRPKRERNDAGKGQAG